MNRYLTAGGVDLTTNNPHPVEYSACICAKQDNGVSNRQSARTGILVKIIREDEEREQHFYATLSR